MLRRKVKMMVLLLVVSLTVGINTSYAQSLWREQLGVFRFGIVTGNRGSQFMTQIRPLRRLLQDKLGVRVEMVPARSHSELVLHMAEERLDFAILSSTAFATAHQMCKCVDPLLVPARQDGSTSFRSVLLVRKDGPGSLSDLQGSTILIPGTESFAGYLYPKTELARSRQGFDHQNWKVIDKQLAIKAVSAFAKGEGDALFGWVQDQPRSTAHVEGQGSFVNELNRIAGTDDQFRVVWSSEPLYHGPYTIRRSLAPQVKNILRKLLSQLPKSDPELYEVLEPVYSGGLRPVQIAAFEPVIEVTKRLLETKPLFENSKLRPSR